MPTSPEAAQRERARRAAGRELEVLLSQAVAELGFVKRRGLYLAPLAPGIERWLALPVKRDGDAFRVYPNVGVRHDELHETVDRLHERKPGNEPTLVRMLGYLMPQNSANVAWEFRGHGDPDWQARARNIAKHIERHAWPWLEQYVTLQAIFDGLDRDGMGTYAPERRPVALMLLGRPEGAAAQLQAELAALGDRTDPAAENFRRFAARLRAELGAA
jgi:hypothetical protein